VGGSASTRWSRTDREQLPPFVGPSAPGSSGASVPDWSRSGSAANLARTASDSLNKPSTSLRLQLWVRTPFRFSALRRGARTVALLADYLICSYQVSLVQAVEQATKSLGMSLLTFAGRRLADPKPDWATQSRIYDLASPDTVDAVLLLSGPVGTHVGAQKLAEFCQRFQPLPVCSVGFELPGIPSLIVSNRQGTRVAIEHLIVQHGATRIAYIRGPSDNEEAVDRYLGYIDALTKHGLPVDEALVVAGEFNVATGAKATRELLSRGVVFDGLAAANDYMALAACEVLTEAGLRIPDDVLVVGFDDAAYARYAIPPLTTVRQPLERLARIAVDWIASALDGKPLPTKMAVDVDLVPRLSCGCGRSQPVHEQPPGSRRTILDLSARVSADRPGAGAAAPVADRHPERSSRRLARAPHGRARSRARWHAGPPARRAGRAARRRRTFS
jgi:DNA-binding LacI/PurR family transcriptional regulator